MFGDRVRSYVVDLFDPEWISEGLQLSAAL
jgi:hypothetical protein